MKILHPTDFSECATHAEQFAVRLARDLKGELVLFQTLVEAPLYGEGILNMREAQRVYDAQRKWAEETLETRAGQIRQAEGIAVRWALQTGVPFEEIVRAAEKEGADMIVMGTHGRSGLNRLLLGSVAERVIRLAPCPVLTVRQPQGKERAAR